MKVHIDRKKGYSNPSADEARGYAYDALINVLAEEDGNITIDQRLTAANLLVAMSGQIAYEEREKQRENRLDAAITTTKQSVPATEQKGA